MKEKNDCLLAHLLYAGLCGCVLSLLISVNYFLFIYLCIFWLSSDQEQISSKRAKGNYGVWMWNLIPDHCLSFYFS